MALKKHLAQEKKRKKKKKKNQQRENRQADLHTREED
jgi:hypothetical protein